MYLSIKLQLISEIIKEKVKRKALKKLLKIKPGLMFVCLIINFKFEAHI